MLRLLIVDRSQPCTNAYRLFHPFIGTEVTLCSPDSSRKSDTDRFFSTVVTRIPGLPRPLFLPLSSFQLPARQRSQPPSLCPLARFSLLPRWCRFRADHCRELPRSFPDEQRLILGIGPARRAIGSTSLAAQLGVVFWSSSFSPCSCSAAANVAVRRTPSVLMVATTKVNKVMTDSLVATLEPTTETAGNLRWNRRPL